MNEFASSSQKQSIRRTDHDNWKTTSSTKRGSYFGSVPKRVKQNLSKIRKSASRSKKVERLMSNRRKSVKVLERRSEGVRHQHKQIKEMKRRLGTVIKEDEEEIQRLQSIKNALSKKIDHKDEELNIVGQDNKALEKRRKKFSDIYNTAVKANNKLCDEGTRLQEEMKRSKRDKTEQREKFGELVQAAARIKTRLENELDSANKMFHERMSTLKNKIQELEHDVLKTRYDDTVVELEMTREKHERVSQLQTDLRFELSEKKAWKLHQALRRTLHAQKQKETKLHKIISHLQKEQHVTDVRRSVIEKELRKYKKALGLEVEEEEEDSLKNNQQKEEEKENMIRSVSRLEEKLQLARIHTTKLENHLKSDEFKNKSKEEKRLMELEKQRSELLIRAQDLEEACFDL